MRRQDWVARLREVVRTYRRAPFSYGLADCGHFAAACVDAVTGSNWRAEIAHGSRREAAAFLKREGGIAPAVTRRLGAPVENHNARRGDVCLVGARALGVCVGSEVLAFSSDGLHAVPLSRVRKHWRVD